MKRFELFIWLFKTFLKSIGDKHRLIMMTTQAFFMVAAIKAMFSFSSS